MALVEEDYGDVHVGQVPCQRVEPLAQIYATFVTLDRGFVSFDAVDDDEFDAVVFDLSFDVLGKLFRGNRLRFNFLDCEVAARAQFGNRGSELFTTMRERFN